MEQRASRRRRPPASIALSLAVFLTGTVAVRAGDPVAVSVPGKPVLPLGSFELSTLGYQVEEFFVSGTATSYRLPGEVPSDGKWEVVRAGTAPYATRMVVVRPTDPKKFNGTVVVEWLNVSGGLDVPVEWGHAHREMIRSGNAYVGLSAQKVGVEGGPTIMGGASNPLKKADPERYGRLSHPGDAFSFDIYSQAGQAVKDAAKTKVLGPLVPKRIIGMGESQSAFFLTTYVTAIDPVAKIYDGYVIHSRGGGAAPLDNSSIIGSANRKPVKLRSDLRVPVITIITETDLLNAGLGYLPAREPDSDHLRVWEIAGTAHADNYNFAGFADSGKEPIEKLAETFAPTDKGYMGNKFDKPMNFGPQHHYVVESALWHLDQWIKTKKPAPTAEPLRVTGGENAQFVLDTNGIAEGGIRSPWVDVPTARLSGFGNSGNPDARLVGVGEPFDSAHLERLYPGGKREYLLKFEASLDSAIAAGFILSADKQEILQVASINFK